MGLIVANLSVVKPHLIGINIHDFYDDVSGVAAANQPACCCNRRDNCTLYTVLYSLLMLSQPSPPPVGRLIHSKELNLLLIYQTYNVPLRHFGVAQLQRATSRLVGV